MTFYRDIYAENEALAHGRSLPVGEIPSSQKKAPSLTGLLHGDCLEVVGGS